MQIITSQPNSNNKTSFGSIILPNREVCTKILTGLNEKQLKKLNSDLKTQKNNPVNAIINIAKNRLTAKIQCPYRLKNFKENYKQIPFIESNIHFFNRIIKKCNEYKKQLNT